MRTDYYSFIFALTPNGNRWNIQHSASTAQSLPRGNRPKRKRGERYPPQAANENRPSGKCQPAPRIAFGKCPFGECGQTLEGPHKPGRSHPTTLYIFHSSNPQDSRFRPQHKEPVAHPSPSIHRDPVAGKCPSRTDTCTNITKSRRNSHSHRAFLCESHRKKLFQADQ